MSKFITIRNDLSVPNGGYGWIVVAGACLTNIFNQSLVSVFGLLFGDKITEMQGTTGAVALVMNIASLFLNFSGIITGPLLKSYSPRSITLVGSFLTGTGMILSAFATQIWHLIISYSFFVGLGLGLIVPSQFMAITQYFTTKKGRAVGIAVAGTGIGQMIMPHIVRYLLEEYAFSGAVLIIGGLAWNGMVGGSLFLPIEKPNPNKVEQNVVIIERKNSIVNGLEKKPSKLPNKYRQCKLKILRVMRQVVNLMDLNLLKDPFFLSLTLGLALAYTASTNFSMIYPFYLQNVANMTKSETATSMSLLAGADLFSRLVLPIFTDHFQASSKLVFLIGILLLICVRTIFAFSSDKVTVMIISIIYGLVRATTVINQNLTVSEYCHKNPEVLGNALGINMTVKGIFVITLGQCLGWIRDATQSYSMTLLAQNVILLVVVCFWLPEMIYQRILARKRKEYQELCC